jgi:glutathione S-transferase
MQILERQLASTGAYVAGDRFSLADIPVGLSVNRWFSTPMEHPHLPAVKDYYQRLDERVGFGLHGRNGEP